MMDESARCSSHGIHSTEPANSVARDQRMIIESALCSDGPHGHRPARIVRAVILTIEASKRSMAERPLRITGLCKSTKGFLLWFKACQMTRTLMYAR